MVNQGTLDCVNDRAGLAVALVRAWEIPNVGVIRILEENRGLERLGAVPLGAGFLELEAEEACHLPHAGEGDGVGLCSRLIVHQARRVAEEHSTCARRAFFRKED